MLEASFNAVSDLMMQETPKYNSWGPIDKCLKFMSLLSHVRKDIRLGGVICLFLLNKANLFQDDLKNVMADELLN